MGFIIPDRAWLESGPLSDRIPESAKCRYVLKLVAALDLSALYASYSAKGADAFDPATMLATWFLAYSDGLTSTRQLEQQCQRDLHYIYISGNLSPDHTSLSRFRQRHLTLMKVYFSDLVRLGSTYACFKEIAIDGSVIQASASKKKNKDDEALERYQRAVAHQIASYLDQSEKQDELDKGELDKGELDKGELDKDELDRLKAVALMLAERAAQLAQRKKKIKADHRAGHKINLVEPDAINHSGRPGYNVQASVDMQTQFIVACDVVSDRNDLRQFKPQYEQTETILGSDKDRQYTLDAGYHSLENLVMVHQQAIDVLFADPSHRSDRVELASVEEILERNKPLKRADFRYEKQEDCYYCPGGDRLQLPSKTAREGKALYQATSCPSCRLRHLCLSRRNQSGLRTITRDHREWLAEAMAFRLESDQASLRMKKRRESVEPVFGNLKSNMGFSRFRLRSLQKVRAEFALMCIGHNINKLFKLACKLLARMTEIMCPTLHAAYS